ncbi:hypothetical protein BGY98DRAFT_911809, partial [Russula aff. rugulosa BPL654]
RLAQTDLPAVAQKWQDLCLASGGDIFTSDSCVNLAGVACINALSRQVDKMIDSAKSPGVTNKDTLIAYRKHPRNAEDIGGGIFPSIPYMAASKRRRSESSNRSSASRRCLE